MRTGRQPTKGDTDKEEHEAGEKRVLGMLGFRVLLGDLMTEMKTKKTKTEAKL